jgi:hypothetical protein
VQPTNALPVPSTPRTKAKKKRKRAVNPNNNGNASQSTNDKRAKNSDGSPVASPRHQLPSPPVISEEEDDDDNTHVPQSAQGDGQHAEPANTSESPRDGEHDEQDAHNFQ